jgi:hypothetical protein
VPKRNSVRARTPAEKYRDDVLLGYPEWPTWSRKLRRIFVSLPSYGVGEDALEAMCDDKKAVNEFVDNNYEYRTATYFSKSKVPLSFQVKWSALQRVYMMESGITSFIKAETGKVSAAENKLIEKAGLLEIEPMVNLPQEKTPKTNTPSNTIDMSGESSLFELEDILNKSSRIKLDTNGALVEAELYSQNLKDSKRSD